MKIFDTVLDTLFPRYCISCKREAGHLCEDCFALISLNTSKISESVYAATTTHDTTLKKALHYYKNPPLLKDLSFAFASLIIAHLALMDKPPFFLLPEYKGKYSFYPISPSKEELKHMGFSSTHEIATELSKLLGVPMTKEITKNTLLIGDVLLPKDIPNQPSLFVAIESN